MIDDNRAFVARVRAAGGRAEHFVRPAMPHGYYFFPKLLTGIAFNPLLLAAMGDVEPDEAGLASGVVNTSFMMGGALGLAILVAVSSWWTGGQPDPTSLESLHGGFQVAFAVGAVFAAAAAAIGGAYLRPKPMVVPDAEAVDEMAVPVH